MEDMEELIKLANTQYGIRTPLPENPVVAMAYVPYQNADKLYSPEQAICMGTLFPELDKPFAPKDITGGMNND